MKVHVLGTGSADGWPNPLCACESCEAVRGRGEQRGQTSVLIDDVVLCDLGADVARSAERHGASLRLVEHIVLSHGHPDHLDPALFLWRSWIADAGPLTVWGPQETLDRIEPWLPPVEQSSGPAAVQLNALKPGDKAVLPTRHGNYSLSAIAAAHAAPGLDAENVDLDNTDVHCATALVYYVVGPDDTSLLYATDTAALSSSAHDALAAAVTSSMSRGACDVVFLDETFGPMTTHHTGHHDLPSFAAELERWRASAIIDDNTDVVAVHLSHHNPANLHELLRPIGARVVRDGTVLHTSPAHESATTGSVRVLIGGARSGKSTYAETLASAYDEVTYVATAVQTTTYPDDVDVEWQERIAAHQARRPAHWRTIETRDLEAVLSAAPRGSCVLIDCATLWLTGLLDDLSAWADDVDRVALQSELNVRTDSLCDALISARADVIVVTNEVGQGVVPATASARLFRDELGRLNVQLASVADHCEFIVGGRVLPLAQLVDSQTTHVLATHEEVAP